MGLNSINVLQEDVQMPEPNANQVRNQGVLEEEDFDGDPNEWEVTT